MGSTDTTTSPAPDGYDGFVHDVASQLPGAALRSPVSDSVAGYRVGGRLFAMCVPVRNPQRVSVRTERSDAALLAVTYDGVCADCHLGVEGWVSIEVGSDVPGHLIEELVVDAWRIVSSRLPGRTAATLLERLDTHTLNGAAAR